MENWENGKWEMCDGRCENSHLTPKPMQSFIRVDFQSEIHHIYIIFGPGSVFRCLCTCVCVSMSVCVCGPISASINTIIVSNESLATILSPQLVCLSVYFCLLYLVNFISNIQHLCHSLLSCNISRHRT